MSELPTVKCGRKIYYFDARLSQLRNVNNPHDFVELSPEETVQLQKQIARAFDTKGKFDYVD